MSKETVIITGAGGGIGTALARRYAAMDYNVALLDIDEAAAKRAAAACSPPGGSALPLCCDVTSFEDCTDAVRQTRDRFGGIDVLIANAGITHLSFFEDTDLSVIHRVMEVNFFGAVNITKATLPELLHAQGQIIAMSSVAGFCPLPMRTGYAASKYAMRGFFESLRAENRHKGLGVLIVCPTYVDTNIGTSALGGDGKAATYTRPEAGNAVSADEVAAKIATAAARRRDFLPVAKGARLAHMISRLSPSVLERLSTRAVMKAKSMTESKSP